MYLTTLVRRASFYNSMINEDTQCINMQSKKQLSAQDLVGHPYTTTSPRGSRMVMADGTKIARARGSRTSAGQVFTGHKCVDSQYLGVLHNSCVCSGQWKPQPEQGRSS